MNLLKNTDQSEGKHLDDRNLSEIFRRIKTKI